MSLKEELLEVFERAKKAADAAKDNPAEEARCIDALKQLKKMPITANILIDTLIGKSLRPITKHPREKIQEVANDLLANWKEVVLDEKAKSQSNGSSVTTVDAKVVVANGKSVKVEKVQRSETVTTEKVTRAETVKVERSVHGETVKSEKVSRPGAVKVEKIETIGKQENDSSRKPQAPKGPPKLPSMIKCNDSARDKTRELLAEAFAMVSNEAEEYMLDEVKACDPIRAAVSVESALFDKIGRQNGAQKVKYRSIVFNIRDTKNPDLRRRLLLGQVKPENLVTMTPEEMASDQRKQEITQIREKNLFDCERAGAPKASTDQFRCGRCGQRKTTYYQLQTRSADEPMTTFVTCVNCNNHWKFC